MGSRKTCRSSRELERILSALGNHHDDGTGAQKRKVPDIHSGAVNSCWKLAFTACIISPGDPAPRCGPD
jgi:hypothetical protein